MVKKLCLYEEQQDKGDTELIQQLNYYERRLGARRLENQQQLDIRAYFFVQSTPYRVELNNLFM
ncbi:predicted protein [Coccidioides posadasii str. Silveira]|uniref:Predicted protein n=1 Tax=Coccidioides posadasii (strain RMSCC 757 / Silveira) TaxID=443226 RepID=E9DEP3_COCPS|nr:predicted protein [Coccidioides posadasii str. Silveira]